MKSKIILSLLFFVCLCFVCTNAFCQTPTSETVTITTYYPAPYGEYRELALTPSDDFTPGASCSKEGAMYYDNSEHQMFVCSGKSGSNIWEPVGLSSLHIESGHGVIPNVCTAAISGVSCTVPWSINITFSKPFYNIPHVLVAPQHVTEDLSTGYATDAVYAAASNITKTGFTLSVGGSPVSVFPSSISDNWTKSSASWIAIGY